MPEHLRWVKFISLSCYRIVRFGLDRLPGRDLIRDIHQSLGMNASLFDAKRPVTMGDGDIDRRITDGRLRPIGSCCPAHSVKARADSGTTPGKDRFTACASSNHHCQPHRNTNTNFHPCSRSYLHAAANLHSLPNIHTFTHSYFISRPGPTNRSHGNHPHAIACKHRDSASQPDSRADS